MGIYWVAVSFAAVFVGVLFWAANRSVAKVDDPLTSLKRDAIYREVLSRLHRKYEIRWLKDEAYAEGQLASLRKERAGVNSIKCAHTRRCYHEWLNYFEGRLEGHLAEERKRRLIAEEKRNMDIEFPK